MKHQPSPLLSRGVRSRAQGSLVIFGVLFVVVAAVWILLRSGAPSPATNNATNIGNVQSATVDSTTSYTDTEFGFFLKHPSGWKVERNSTGEGENRIVNIVMGDGSQGVTLVVVPLELEGIVRESISIISENEMTINDKQATRIHALTAKDGSPIDLLLFRSRGMLIDLNGPADLVTSIGQTIVLE